MTIVIALFAQMARFANVAALDFHKPNCATNLSVQTELPAEFQSQNEHILGEQTAHLAGTSHSGSNFVAADWLIIQLSSSY